MDFTTKELNAIQVMRARRAVRDYALRAVDQALVQEIIDDAVLAPSAMNRQAWSFTVIRDRKLLDDISGRAKAFMLSFMKPGSDLEPLRPRLETKDFNIFYNAPVAVVISATAADEFATYDCCLAASNLMHAAWIKGLGSCWIGMAEGWLNTSDGKVALKIPSSHRPVATIILGYAHSTPSPTPRRSPSITWIN